MIEKHSRSNDISLLKLGGVECVQYTSRGSLIETALAVGFSHQRLPPAEPRRFSGISRSEKTRRPSYSVRAKPLVCWAHNMIFYQNGFREDTMATRFIRV